MAFSYFGFVTCIFQWCFSRLNLGAYTTLKAYNKLPKSWAEEIAERPAYKRGSRVNRAPSPEDNAIVERHDASDLD